MKFLLAILMTSVSLSCFSAPTDRLIDALIHVESKGNIHAVGDNGRAIGCLQIHKGTVDDVNKAYGCSYTYEDRKCPIKSREICKKYLVLHGGYRASSETYARIWNGGPRGHKRSSTRSYWRRVKRHLKYSQIS